MESPFANANASIVMYLEPILNNYNKTYLSIVTLSNMPEGPLKEMVCRINPPKLSDFQPASPFSINGSNCMYAVMRYPRPFPVSSTITNSSKLDTYMYSDDIPSIISYLTSNGYKVDTKITNMLQHSNINIGGPAPTRMSGNRRMVCMFTYENK